MVNAAFPSGLTRHIESLVSSEQNDPIKAQFFPDAREETPGAFELEDPLGETRHLATARLVHQYRDRALLLAGGACAAYCRYCFRRVWLASKPGFVSGSELEQALAYIAAHPEIHEVLVSGGDPLTADNARLEELFRLLRQTRPELLLRICTRIPLTNPSRFDDETIALFRRFRPLRLSIHVNHTNELAPVCRERLAACVDSGIPVHTQTVLLRGVNDDAALLARLFRECLNLGLNPYYLFQIDLAPGTAHFRVPLKRGLEIYRELSALVSGLALPAYALELPGGGGKIRLHEGVIAEKK
jgi:lysine 2,3-aminomutase